MRRRDLDVLECGTSWRRSVGPAGGHRMIRPPSTKSKMLRLSLTNVYDQ